MDTYVEIDADSADCHSDRFRVGQRRNRYGARLQDICRPVPRLHVVEGQTQLVRQPAAMLQSCNHLRSLSLSRSFQHHTTRMARNFLGAAEREEKLRRAALGRRADGADVRLSATRARQALVIIPKFTRELCPTFKFKIYSPHTVPLKDPPKYLTFVVKPVVKRGVIYPLKLP